MLFICCCTEMRLFFFLVLVSVQLIESIQCQYNDCVCVFVLFFFEEMIAKMIVFFYVQCKWKSFEWLLLLLSNRPTASKRFLRVKCRPMKGDDLVGKLRNKYGSPSRTSGLCETFTFSPVMSSHNFVKSHSRSVQSSDPVAKIVPSRLKHNVCTVLVWPVNAAIKWP